MKNYLDSFCKFIFLILVSTFTSQPAPGQAEMNHWLFGYGAGINFNGGNPVPATGALQNWEGCAAVSDAGGNLLFYTDGSTVWNRTHQPMPNGTGLAGDSLSTQSALIVPQPGNDSCYYIFTLAGEAGPNGLRYTLVNTRLDGGLGDVITAKKNLPLLTPVCEKIAAVRHRNANDTWIITHQFGSNAFYVYLLNCNGIASNPNIIPIGNVVNRVSNGIGYLKAAPDGKAIAMAGFSSVVEIFDFDNLSGLISNPRAINSNPNNISGPYGVEFSPDSKLLYVSESYNKNASGAYAIYQYQLLSPNISQSRFTVDSGYNFAAGALQLAPDGRIYIAFDQQNFLGAITHPSIAGTGCGFNKQYLALAAGSRSGVGLPSFVSGYHSTLIGKDSTLCSGQVLVLHCSLPATTVLWSNGSTADSLVVTTTGNYSVTIKNNGCVYYDTSNIFFQSVPGIDLGNDTAICGNQFPISLSQNVPGTTWFWQDSSTSPLQVIQGPGIYWLQASFNGCTARDSITIAVLPVTPFYIGADTTICSNTPISLAIPGSFKSYLWDNGGTANAQSFSLGGYHWCEAVNANGCIYRDSMLLTVIPAPVFSLGNDTVICNQNELILNPNVFATSFRWQDGNSQSTYRVTNAGAYSLEARNNGCIFTDTIFVEKFNTPAPYLGNDTTLCAGQQLAFSLAGIGNKYLWQDGSTSRVYVVNKPGNYSVTVTNKCGVGKDELVVAGGNCPLAIPGAFTPGKLKNNNFRVLNAGPLPGFNLVVYDRWGRVVYQTVNPLSGWNGTYKGVLLPAGAYVYLITYLDAAVAKKIVVKGTVLLIR